MKLFTYSFLFIAVACVSGCSTENPLCTDNYCVEGEIYPRSELATGQAYSELAVDDAAFIAALTNATPLQPVEPAAFVSASPAAGGEVAANGTITVTFDNAPADVTVSAGTVTVAGKTATVTGPFTPSALALTVTLADGNQTLNYTVVTKAVDSNAPISIVDIISDAQRHGANSQYNGQTLTLTAVVDWKNDEHTTIFVSDSADLEEFVFFLISARSTPSAFRDYHIGGNYTFRVNIVRIFTDEIGILNIWARLQ